MLDSNVKASLGFNNDNFLIYKRSLDAMIFTKTCFDKLCLVELGYHFKIDK